MKNRIFSYLNNEGESTPFNAVTTTEVPQNISSSMRNPEKNFFSMTQNLPGNNRIVQRVTQTETFVEYTKGGKSVLNQQGEEQITNILLELQACQIDKLVLELVNANKSIGISEESTLFELYQKDIVSMGYLKTYLGINQYQFNEMLKSRNLKLINPLTEEEKEEQFAEVRRLFGC